MTSSEVPTYSDHLNNAVQNAITEVPPRRKRSTAATWFSLLFVIPYIAILIASVVALAFMVYTNNSVRYGDGHCLLYATYENDFKLTRGPSCKFVIFGEGALGVLAILLILLSIVKAIVGKWLSPMLLFDYYVLIFGVILSMSVGITLSVGITETCDAYGDMIPSFIDLSCSEYFLPSNDPDLLVYFYKGLHKVELVAWGVFGLYFLLLTAHCAMTCVVYINKRKSSRVPYENLEIHNH